MEHGVFGMSVGPEVCILVVGFFLVFSFVLEFVCFGVFLGEGGSFLEK